MTVATQEDADNLSASLVAVYASISTAGVLQEASPKVLKPVRNALLDAVNKLVATAAAIDVGIASDSVGGVDTVTPVPLMWDVLTAQAIASAQEAILLTARGYLGRAKVNVDREPS